MSLIELLRRRRASLPDWVQDWLDVLVPALQTGLILLAAWLLHWLLKRLVLRLARRYSLPPQIVLPLRGVLRWLIITATVLLVLGRLGVSASVLWTAFTGFAAVGAVAFFAAWSVLSNLFCALLIMVAQPFRLGDDVEVLDTAEKPGAKGRVVDINLLYTTLQEADGGGRLLQIPNALFFQRVVRRWRGGMAGADAASEAAPLPGFRIFCGSSARLMVRIMSTAPLPVSATRNAILCSPTPCSPVQVPPSLSARSTSWWLSRSAVSRSAGIFGSIR
jgi:hypothetical protein